MNSILIISSILAAILGSILLYEYVKDRRYHRQHKK